MRKEAGGAAVATTGACFDNGAWIWDTRAPPNQANRLVYWVPRFMSAENAYPDRLHSVDRSDEMEKILQMEKARAADLRVEQYSEPNAQMVERLQITKKLGSGSFGTVFACHTTTTNMVPVNRLVIKLSNDMFTGLNGSMVGEKMQKRANLGHAGWARLQQEALDVFTDEFCNAERILEPPEVLWLRAQHYHHGGDSSVGKPLPPLTVKEYWYVLYKRAQRVAKVGYGYLHRQLHLLAHIEPSVFPGHLYELGGPAILSEMADGNLDSILREECLRKKDDWFVVSVTTEGSMPRVSCFWLHVAWQILQAMRFISENGGGLRYVDLKLENFLYCGTLGGSLRCMLADYGLCMERDEVIIATEVLKPDRFDFRMGTPMMNPYIDATNDPIAYIESWARINGGGLSDFQVMSTLVYMLCFRIIIGSSDTTTGGGGVMVDNNNSITRMDIDGEQHNADGGHHLYDQHHNNSNKGEVWHALSSEDALNTVESMAACLHTPEMRTLSEDRRQSLVVPRLYERLKQEPKLEELQPPARILRILLDMCADRAKHTPTDVSRMVWGKLAPAIEEAVERGEFYFPNDEYKRFIHPMLQQESERSQKATACAKEAEDILMTWQ